MIILIDAYNLLKTVLQVKFITDAQRAQFLRKLEDYALFRPHNKIILVFDGGPGLYPVQEHHNHLTIWYAGASQSADDFIKKKVYDCAAYDILLITCDREIRKYAQQHQVESLGSLEFYRIMQQVMHNHDQQEKIMTSTLCKTSSTDNHELDYLMDLGSRRLIVKDDDKKRAVLVSIPVDHATKKNKKLLKKIAKL